MAQTLRALPVGMFGAVMGLAGLGLVWRSGASFLGLSRLPGEVFLAIAALALALLLPAYLLKAIRYPDAVGEELSNPALLGFCAALPIGMTLVAGGLQPYSEQLANGLWWTGVALLVALQLRMLYRMVRGGIALAQVNAGWMIVFIGGIVVPSSGLALGHAMVSIWIFGASTFVAPVVMGLVAWRIVFGPPTPDAAKPTWFILLVPPALIYANGTVLFGAVPGSPIETLYYCALALLGVLLLAVRGFPRWPFGAPWWTFTFPLDALAAAGVRHAAGQDWALWRSIAGALLALATLAVVVVLVRTLWVLAHGRMFLPPPGTPPK